MPRCLLPGPRQAKGGEEIRRSLPEPTRATPARSTAATRTIDTASGDSFPQVASCPPLRTSLAAGLACRSLNLYLFEEPNRSTYSGENLRAVLVVVVKRLRHPHGR